MARRPRYNPLAGKCCTVPINALRPVGCSVDPEYEALMASKLIESNRNIFVEAALGHCCATSFGRQASDIPQVTRSTLGLPTNRLLPQLKVECTFCRMYVEHLKLWRSAFRCTVMSLTQNCDPRSITLMTMTLWH